MLNLEHSAILLTFIKQPFTIKIFVLSIYVWPLKTGFTENVKCQQLLWERSVSVVVLDSRQRDSGFEPHQRHCVMSLSKTHLS